jgi:hypothetical protein
MNENLSSQGEKLRSFWDRYVKKLNESGVKPPFDRWMVIRAEQYIAAHPDRRAAEHKPADFDAYRTELARHSRLKPWPFRQAVGALRMLFILVRVD